jgi:hypothetical protein
MLFSATKKRLTLKIFPNFKNLTKHAKKKEFTAQRQQPSRNNHMEQSNVNRYRQIESKSQQVPYHMESNKVGYTRLK